MIRPVAVYVISGSTAYAITSLGLSKEDLLKECGRGVIIATEYLGECEHRWRESAEFCEGSVLQETKQIHDIFYDLIGPSCTIWRD